MRRFVSPLVLCLLGSFLSFARGKEITLRDDDATIRVPVPKGFTPVSETSDHFESVAAITARRGNDLMALFVPVPYTGEEENFPRMLPIALLRSDRGRLATQAALSENFSICMVFRARVYFSLSTSCHLAVEYFALSLCR